MGEDAALEKSPWPVALRDSKQQNAEDGSYCTQEISREKHVGGSPSLTAALLLKRER